MKILLCGGAGYIGSHMVLELLENNYDVCVIDNLEKGHKEAVSKDAELFVGDLRDTEFLDKFFASNKVDAVVDFAAYSLVGESVEEPFKYYANNVGATLNLLQSMRKAEVNKIVFSSTAATYGEPENTPITETEKTIPTNPYGETKLAVEKMLKWADNAYGIKNVILRYFNVAGAHASGKIGEDHSPESHLIPKILEVPLGKTQSIKIFGNDYPTFDGTCIRDYIHVSDLANAHLLGLQKLFKDNTSSTYNLGNGDGFSVRQVLDTARKITGHAIPETIESRRAGDPSTLVASSEKIISELHWERKFSKLEQIIESAWAWHKANPNGYKL